ncbi:MAG: hypothetical protein ACREJP_05450 [Candidatus Methylomirabilales bacterium]
MKALALAAVAILVWATPVAADDDGDDYGQCKYVCAERLVICIQPDSCHFDRER